MSTRPRPFRSARRRAGTLVLACALALLTACGGDTGSSEATATPESSPAETSAAETTSSPEGTGSSAEGESITATEGDFFIELDEDTLTAGSYEIEVVNEGDATHDLVVERDGEDVAASETIDPGQSTTVSVDLEPGEYVFYCSIGNHREMGMEVTVQVT